MPASANKNSRYHNPSKIVILSFAFLILVGTVLLASPWASRAGQTTPFIDAFFTATSAVCVTGLTAVDISLQYSLLGQTILLILIQLGGLGMMVWSGGAILLLGGRLGLAERAALQETVPGMNLSGASTLLKGAVTFTLACELIGALILWLYWTPRLGAGDAAFAAVFHSVSAFCNAGFSLWSDSLSKDATSFTVNAVIITLITLGGLGFLLMLDLWTAGRCRRRLTLHTRIALVVSATLVASGTLLFFLLETTNPKTIGELSWQSQIGVSLFQSVTTRTAGFNTVPLQECRDETLLVMMGLMLIGGCPGSTAGGIKTTTLAVLFASVLALFRGRRDIVIWERKIPQQRVTQSVAITASMLLLVWVGTIVLCALNPSQLTNNVFEVVSAVATVGLTLGSTPEFSSLSKFVLCLLMFIGRVGPLALAVSLVGREDRPFKYVREDVRVG